MAALLAALTACDGGEPSSRPPGDGGPSTRAPSTGPSTPEQRPVSRRLGEAYRYDDGAVDATVTVDRFRETAPPPGDLIAVTVVVDVHDGAWTFGPELVRLSYDGADRGTGTVVSGPSTSAARTPGPPTRWVLRFGLPARTSGAAVTVHARPTLPLAEWRL